MRVYIKLAAALGVILLNMGVASSVFAASPYTDEFENFNSTGWLSSFNLLQATTTDCYVGACVSVYKTGGNELMYHRGSATAVGGFRIWFRHSAGQMSVQLCPINIINNDTCINYSGKISLSLSNVLTGESNNVWHSLDLVFEPTATSTRYRYVIDYYLDNSFGDWSYLGATSTVLNFNGIVLSADSGIGNLYSFDSLQNEFSLSQFTSADLVNQSLSISTSTLNSYCDINFPYDNSTIITATITFVPNGLCRLAFFMVVPSSDSLNQFNSIPDIFQTKFPFSWAYGIYNIFSSVNASSTNSLSTISLSFSTIIPTTTLVSVPDWTVFSSTTVLTYMSQSQLDIFKGIMVVVIWVVFASFVFFEIKNLISV